MGVRRKNLLRVAILGFGLIAICNFYYGVHGLLHALALHRPISPFKRHTASKEAQGNLGLNEKECTREFPGLVKEINDAVARGPFVLNKQPDDYMGLVQARIKHGKVGPAIRSGF